jgi:hypothetical protein
MRRRTDFVVSQMSDSVLVAIEINLGGGENHKFDQKSQFYQSCESCTSLFVRYPVALPCHLFC